MSEDTCLEPSVLFVGNIPYSLDDSGFCALMKEHGEVAIAAVVRDERDRSRGFGFVRFVDAANATAAQASLCEKQLEERKVRASFARHDSRYIEIVDESLITV